MKARHSFNLIPLSIFINFEYTEEDVLHQAAANGDLETVKNLIEQQETPEKKTLYINKLHSLYEVTPLALACELGHQNVVEYLIENGANLYKTSTSMHRSIFLMESIIQYPEYFETKDRGTSYCFPGIKRISGNKRKFI